MAGRFIVLEGLDGSGKSTQITLLAQALQASAEGPKAAGDGATRVERAVVLYCLYYDNFGFRFYHGTTYEEVRTTVDACRAAGVGLWQADFEVSPEGVALKGYWPLEEW